MLSPAPDSLSGGYAPSEPARPNSANRQRGSGERSTFLLVDKQECSGLAAPLQVTLT